MLEACNSSTNDNGIIIAKAAHILRKQLFLSKEVSDGDLIRKRQSNSVPLLLLQMIQMILKDNASKISNESSRVIINISQLIRFNSVKQKRRGSAENVSQRSTKYNNDGIACLPKLEPGLFVTRAIDNIDHNLSYNPATSSFHGILISIFQHSDGLIQHRPFVFVSENTSTRRNKLPSSYADIKPSKRGKPEQLELYPN